MKTKKTSTGGQLEEIMFFFQFAHHCFTDPIHWPVSGTQRTQGCHETLYVFSALVSIPHYIFEAVANSIGRRAALVMLAAICVAMTDEKVTDFPNSYS